MNQKDQMKAWLVKWFSEHTGKPAAEIEENSDNSYFELGYIDSFEFIELIENLEEEQGLSFENDAFENRDFATISGLAQICAALKDQGE